MDIVALILSIALEVGVPPHFALAIAYTENRSLNPYAINYNRNGTIDRGVMQLNSRYFNVRWYCAETNVRAGIRHIRWLMDQWEGNTFWIVAVAYNAGLSASRSDRPPGAALTYADDVMRRWYELAPYEFSVLVY